MRKLLYLRTIAIGFEDYFCCFGRRIKMCRITTHILDTSLGKPVGGLNVQLSFLKDNQWDTIAEEVSNADGRSKNLLSSHSTVDAGTYRLRFETRTYFQANRKHVFYPWIDVVFNIENGIVHKHIPLLLSPYGYSSYLGS